jgi:hypothetical protein
MLAHNVVSCGILMQYACGNVTLVSPFIFFHRDSYNNNSPGTFQYNLAIFSLSETIVTCFLWSDVLGA